MKARPFQLWWERGVLDEGSACPALGTALSITDWLIAIEKLIWNHDGTHVFKTISNTNNAFVKPLRKCLILFKVFTFIDRSKH
jgi:hypothetical protein